MILGVRLGAFGLVDMVCRHTLWVAADWEKVAPAQSPRG
jgi:hypothetical protein